VGPQDCPLARCAAVVHHRNWAASPVGRRAERSLWSSWGTDLPSIISGALAGFIPSLAFLALDAGLGEEPGWRGFALPGLEGAYTPIAATAVLGVLWAFWHFPLVFIDHRFPYGFTSLAPLVLLALLTLGRHRTHGILPHPGPK